MDKSPWYIPAFHEFLRRNSPPRNVTAAFFQDKQNEFGFDQMESMICIGPDDGRYEMEVLKAFPRCQHFIGIDPSKDSLIALDENLKKCHPNIESDLKQAKVEDWSGPTEKVDIVLAAHVMYNVEEPRHVVLDRFLSWVKPGGLVVTIIVEEIIIFDIRPKLKNYERACVQIYTQPMMKKDLSLKPATIICEKPYAFQFDVRNPNKALADLVQYVDCTDEEVEEAYTLLQEHAPTGITEYNDVITVITPKY